MGEFKFYFVKCKQTKPKTKQQKPSHKAKNEKRTKRHPKSLSLPKYPSFPAGNDPHWAVLRMAAGLPEPDGSCWRPWRSSHQPSILTFGRGWQIFFPSTLKNVANHSSSLWWGTGGWLTLSSSVQIQMLRNNFPPTLARTSAWTVGQHTICHPEPYTL